MSRNLKIGILIGFIIVGIVLVFMDKITWMEFAGSLTVFNSGILIVEQHFKTKETQKLKEEIKKEL